ncbi:hypothetical protein PITC_088870 [Penicillium italicum]|uniref:Uncharacterized protein n=1 Tax=Penicillium italicum TaxID=40296 RepID=A0A0A2LB90_PENIT|nr:hypothetical protein PITC_088870 [Penicillium italicum]
MPTVPKTSSLAVGAIAPPRGASNSSSSTSRPVIPISNAIQPAQATSAPSTSLQLPTSGSKPVMTVTEPVIVYVTKGSPTPFSTSVIHHAPSVNNSSVSSANPTVEPSSEPTTTSLNFVTIHSTAISVVRMTVYPTSSSPASSSSVLPTSTGSASSVDAPPEETGDASGTSVVPITASSATPSLPSSSLSLSSPDEIDPVVTAHVTSTSVIPLTVYPTASLPSSMPSLLPPSNESASIVTVRITSTSVVPLTVYSTTSPSAPLLPSSSETAPLETAPVVTENVTSTSAVPMTVYSATSLPSTVSSVLPSFSETASRETAPAAAVPTSTKSVHLTLNGSTSTEAAETTLVADPTSTVDAHAVTTISQPGQGILTVNPITPSGFITITETETKTVTDRITETVTATVTLN